LKHSLVFYESAGNVTFIFVLFQSSFVAEKDKEFPKEGLRLYNFVIDVAKLR